MKKSAVIATLFTLFGVSCAASSVNRPVKDVNITGNHAYSDGDIVDHLATQPPAGWLVKTPEEFDPVGLQLDRKRVEAFYHEHGYFSARVTDVNVEKTDGNGRKVTITVEEGEPTRIAAIDVAGPESDVAKPVFRNKETPQKGDVFKHPDYLLVKDLLQKELVKRGYAHADVKGLVEVDRDAHTATVRYDIDPGPLVRFGKTKVEGLKTMPESIVRNRITWTEGAKFNPDKIDATSGRLTATGYFAAARTEVAHEGRPPDADLTLRVAEASKHELRFGFGAGIDQETYQLRVRGGYTVRGVFGDELETLKLDVVPGYSILRTTPSTSGPTIQARSELTRDDFLVPNLRGIVDLDFLREPHIGYILTGPRLNLGVEHSFADDDLKARVGWEMRETTFSQFDPMVFPGAATAQWIAYFQQRLIYDKRDFPLEAREGYYASVELLEGGPWSGGEVTVFRVTGELRGYVPLGRRFVLAARAKGGKLWTGNGQDAPVPLRYLGGGANDNRGFGFERLAPQLRDSDGNLIPVGGSEVTLGSLEARVYLFKMWKRWLSFAAFLDAGDVTAPGMMDFGNLNYAVGGGLRYDTFVGPVRVDLGYRLNRFEDIETATGVVNPDPDSRWSFHFSIGEAF